MLYDEIKQKLIQLMLERKWEPGYRLPSDRSLSQRWKVSNRPVRRAIDELCKINVLRRLPGQGVEVAEGVVATEYRSRLGFLSVGVPYYPPAEFQMELTKMLKKHQCALQVFHSERELNRGVLGEMAACDFLVISGFLSPFWIEAIRSLNKPTMLFGTLPPDYKGVFASVDMDCEAMFGLMIRRAAQEHHNKILVWLPQEMFHSQAQLFLESFQHAWKKNARQEMSYVLDFPDENLLASFREAMARNRDFDTLFLRHSALVRAAQVPGWQEWLGERRGMALESSNTVPKDFTKVSGFLLVGGRGVTDILLKYLFTEAGREKYDRRHSEIKPVFISDNLPYK